MGISGGPYIVRDSSLIFELDAADKNSYVVGSSVWYDLTPNKYDGTLTNGPLFSNENNGVLILDGVNDFISISNASSGSAAGSFTWDVWCSPQDLTTNFDPIARGRDGAGNGWSIYSRIVQTTGQFQSAVVTTTPSQLSYIATSSIALGVTASAKRWYNIVGTWTTGSKVELYVNGDLAGTTSTTSTNLRTSTVGWNLGTLSTSNFTPGRIATARIYNRALSADEIKQNYVNLASRFVTGSGTVYTTTTTTTTSTTTTTTTALYTVTVRVGNSATRTVGGIAGVYYKLGAGGTKTTLATGITGPDCPTVSTVGTISNIPNGTVLYIGPQLGGTTDQTFGAGGCVGSPLVLCGFNTNPHIVTVNSNLTIDLHLNVSAGAYTTC